MKPFLRNFGRGALAAIVFALSFGTVFSATTGTSRTQQALLELFCDACGQPQNVNIRDLAASTVTLQDAQTVTGAKTFSGGISANGVPSNLCNSAIPMIKASTGSMANNGAVTGLTALPLTYNAPGAWIWLPAGAVAAGVPASASWLWFVASSTTAGTVFNSTYTTGCPGIGVQTAFVTTGPGAFTGDTGEVFGPQIAIPANIGAAAWIRAEWQGQQTNNANAKTLRVRYSGSAGTIISSGSIVSQAAFRHTQDIENRGTAVQYTHAMGIAVGTPYNPGSPVVTTQDTSSASTLTMSIQASGAATDNVIFERVSVTVLSP